MITKLLNCISVITIFLFWIVAIYSAFLMYYPYKIIVFNDEFFPVQTKTVKQGDNLQYVASYCKYVNLPAEVTRVYENGIAFGTTTTMTSNIDKGCNSKIISVPIPPELPKGKYLLKNIYRYQINPLREIIITHYTEEFEVIE